MIVIHIDSKQDTAFLKKCYEGIDNLILLYNPTKDEVNKTLQDNPDEDVMMLGHGSPFGLFSCDWKGDVIDASNAHLLKGRNCIGIWCWANKFAENYGLKGYFTSMFISNEGEARSFGYKADDKEVFEEVEFFAKSVNTLVKDHCPYEEWVGKLRSIANVNKPFVKYNYDGMTYFDGTQKPKFSGFVDTPLWDGDDTETDYEDDSDDDARSFFEDYCYENGIEGEWATELAWPIFLAGWNSNKYSEKM